MPKYFYKYKLSQSFVDGYNTKNKLKGSNKLCPYVLLEGDNNYGNLKIVSKFTDVKLTEELDEQIFGRNGSSIDVTSVANNAFKTNQLVEKFTLDETEYDKGAYEVNDDFLYVVERTRRVNNADVKAFAISSFYDRESNAEAVYQNYINFFNKENVKLKLKKQEDGYCFFDFSDIIDTDDAGINKIKEGFQNTDLPGTNADVLAQLKNPNSELYKRFLNRALLNYPNIVHVPSPTPLSTDPTKKHFDSDDVKSIQTHKAVIVISLLVMLTAASTGSLLLIIGLPLLLLGIAATLFAMYGIGRYVQSLIRNIFGNDYLLSDIKVNEARLQDFVKQNQGKSWAYAPTEKGFWNYVVLALNLPAAALAKLCNVLEKWMRNEDTSKDKIGAQWCENKNVYKALYKRALYGILLSLELVGGLIVMPFVGIGLLARNAIRKWSTPLKDKLEPHGDLYYTLDKKIFAPGWFKDKAFWNLAGLGITCVPRFLFGPLFYNEIKGQTRPLGKIAQWLTRFFIYDFDKDMQGAGPGGWLNRVYNWGLDNPNSKTLNIFARIGLPLKLLFLPACLFSKPVWNGFLKHAIQYLLYSWDNDHCWFGIKKIKDMVRNDDTASKKIKHFYLRISPLISITACILSLGTIPLIAGAISLVSKNSPDTRTFLDTKVYQPLAQLFQFCIYSGKDNWFAKTRLFQWRIQAKTNNLNAWDRLGVIPKLLAVVPFLPISLLVWVSVATFGSAQNAGARTNEGWLKGIGKEIGNFALVGLLSLATIVLAVTAPVAFFGYYLQKVIKSETGNTIIGKLDEKLFRVNDADKTASSALKKWANFLVKWAVSAVLLPAGIVYGIVFLAWKHVIKPLVALLPAAKNKAKLWKTSLGDKWEDWKGRIKESYFGLKDIISGLWEKMQDKVKAFFAGRNRGDVFKPYTNEKVVIENYQYFKNSQPLLKESKKPGNSNFTITGNIDGKKKKLAEKIAKTKNVKTKNVLKEKKPNSEQQNGSENYKSYY